LDLIIKIMRDKIERWLENNLMLIFLSSATIGIVLIAGSVVYFVFFK